MLKRIGKYVLRGILILVGFVGVVLILLYLPPVQNFVKDKALRQVSAGTGMDITVEKIRLRFPLIVNLKNARVITSRGDTLLRCGALDLNVAVLPLLRKHVRVRGIAIQKAYVNYSDTTSQMALRGTLEEFAIRSARANLAESTLNLRTARLENADVSLSLGESTAPDTAASSPLLWKIGAANLELSNVKFHMNTYPDIMLLNVDLPVGTVRDCSVDLGRQNVEAALVRLENGTYSFLTDTPDNNPAQEMADTPESDSTGLWTVRVGGIEIEDNRFTYGAIGVAPKRGFDPGTIVLTGININIDSAYNRGSDVAAQIRSLSAKERSGLEVVEASGGFAMDSTGVKLTGFSLATNSSTINADATAQNRALYMDPNAALSLRLDAGISASDILLLLPLDENVRRAIAGRYIHINGRISGTLSSLDVNSLQVLLPGHIALDASGRVTSVTNPNRMGGKVNLKGVFTNMDFVKAFIPDTALGNRIGFPRVMTLTGQVEAVSGVYSPRLRISADSGDVFVRGRYDSNNQAYGGIVAARNFPLYRFLPTDSLGLLSMGITAEGAGFDFTGDGTVADVKLKINRFDYRSYNYHDIDLTASLQDHKVSGELTSGSEALDLNVDISGELRPGQYSGGVRGTIRKVDLKQMNFAQTPLNASMQFDAMARTTGESVYQGFLIVDSLRLNHGRYTDAVPRASVRAEAGSNSVSATVRTGDLTLDFDSPVSINNLISGFRNAVRIIGEQIDSLDIDMEPVERALPRFRLAAAAGRNNVVRSLLRRQGFDFNTLVATATVDGTRPMRTSVVVKGVRTGGLTLDTLNMGAYRRGEKLNYYLRLANRPGNRLGDMALIALYGNAGNDSLRANIEQRSKADSVGFRFGLNAVLSDTAVRVSMFPENPIFGYGKWELNPDNYVTYEFDSRNIFADVQLHGGVGGDAVIQSWQQEGVPRGAVKAYITGVKIEEALNLLPSPPPVAGAFNTDLIFKLNKKFILANGSLGVDRLYYDKRKVGDINAKVRFVNDSVNQIRLNGSLEVDQKTALTVRGRYNPVGEGSINAVVEIPGFNLAAVNAFLPEEDVQLAGELRGDMTIGGPSSRMALNGGINFVDGRVSIPVIGTSFGLSQEPITVADSKLDFNSFALVSPNRQLLTLDGTVDVGDLSKLTTDLELYATNFQLINSTRDGGSMVYGNASLDVDITAKGAVDALTVRGDVNLLRTTGITYTMRDSPLEVQDAKQHIVTFVSFDDEGAFAEEDTLAQRNRFGLDVLVNASIAEGVNATVDLAEDGSNRIELVGGGDLAFSMNSQGDTRFTGRYDISSGTVVYNPPVISQKNFSINPDSYVNWTGEIADPSFNIKATETVKTTVTTDGGNTSNVDFDIIVSIRNTLRDLAIVFDLAAPGNLEIQNQLTSLAPEQRSQQAMALMVYNTYTGPGTTAKVDGNNPLNSFIEKELSQWARNSLKNVDVSFGINTVDDAATGGGQHTDYSYKVSKTLFDDRFKVTVGGSINTEANTSDNLRENFVDDISLEYQLTKRDNMFLKLYRYNTRESIFEGEVVETGAGFVVRKKMSKLSQLFRLTRSPEKKREREAEKTVRREVKQAGEKQAQARDERQESRRRAREGQPDPGRNREVKQAEEKQAQARDEQQESRRRAREGRPGPERNREATNEENQIYPQTQPGE